MTVPKFIEKAIEGGWKHAAVTEAVFLFGGCANVRAFVNGFGWVILHDKDDDASERGGLFNEKAQSFRKEEIFLDPAAWQAVGKVEGWVCSKKHAHGRLYDCSRWRRGMHLLIDHLADGGTIESYLASL